MSQTGTIYGYHDGNTYSLANIYDEKASELEFDTLSNSGLSSDCITARVVLFDTETGILNSWYKGEVASTSGYATAFYANSKRNDGLNFISSENAQFDYAIHLDKSQKTYLRILDTAYGISTARNSKNDWTIEFWYCIDTTTESDTGIIFTTGRYAKAKNDGNYDAKTFSYRVLSFYYSYTETTAEIFLGSTRPSTWTYVRELDRSVFDAPFHMAIVGFEAGQHNRIYINGELYCYETNAVQSTLPIYTLTAMFFGTNITYSSKYYSFGLGSNRYSGTLSEFRLTLGARYHDNFTPQSFQGKVVYVPANMLIRHNDANHYIPLTADAANTSAPYLAVRHGNTNFYTLK